MSEIDSLVEDFDETSDEVDTTESEVVESNASNDDLDPNRVLQTTDSTYNFDKTTVILGIQILPATAQSERQVLLSAGIKGELPIISSISLAQIEQVEEVANILKRLKQALPALAEKALLRAENQRQNVPQRKQPQRVAATPELPPTHSSPSPASSQLSLF